VKYESRIAKFQDILIECRLYWLHSRLQSLNKLKNSVWAKYMGGPHGRKFVWATAHTAPAPMVVHIGESAVEIMTGADSNNVTETQYIDKPGTGMSGF